MAFKYVRDFVDSYTTPFVVSSWYLQGAVEGVNPSLWFDYLNDRYAVNSAPTTFDASQTFSRSTTATGTSALGLIVGYLIDEERLEYSTGLRGLLMEEARVNIARYSEDLTQISSGNWGVTLTSTPILSSETLQGKPVYEFTFSSAAIGASRLANLCGNNNPVGANTYSIRIPLRADEATPARIRISSSGVRFVDQEEIIITTEWQWFDVVVTGLVTDTGGINVDVASNGQADVTIYSTMWMIEEGSFPTSYQPTDGASAPRDAGNNTLTGTQFSDWYNADGMTFVVTVKQLADLTGQSGTIFRLGSGSDFVSLFTSSSNGRISVFIQTGGVPQTAINTGVSAFDALTKIALSIEDNNIRISANGGSVSKNLTTTLPDLTGADMFIGSIAGSSSFNGSFYDLRAYPTADFTDETLQELATAAPINTIAPVLSGIEDVGETLSVTSGIWTGIPVIIYNYQWQRSNIDILGETASTYNTTPSDSGNTVRCEVTATNSGGSVVSYSNETGVIANAPTGYEYSVYENGDYELYENGDYVLIPTGE